MDTKKVLAQSLSYIRRYRWVVAATVVIALIGIATTFILYNREPANTIPTSLKDQVAFVIFYPPKSQNWSIDATSYKYDTSAKVFSYILRYGPVHVTIAQQATPQNFIDIPEAYGKLTDSLNEYASFDSYYDKVSLTHPKEYKGQQTAVMNSKGTFVFAHPTDGDLTEDQWKRLFNNFEVIR